MNLLKDRFMTQGIEQKVDDIINLRLWCMIDELSKSEVEVDYLQIFNVKSFTDNKGNKKVEIIHKQEQPTYEKIVVLDNVTDIKISEKIFVIDSGNYITMMLAEEY